MKAKLLTLVLLSSVLCAPMAQAAGKHGSWSLNDADKAALGISGKSISSLSKESLQGADNAGKVELGYSCNGEFYLNAKGKGFAIDGVDCGPYGCKKRQHGQLKFDANQITKAEFEIMSDSNGMFLLSDKAMLVKEMKAGSNVKLEVELANTDGKEQMATFSLRGFTAAHNWCAK